MLLIPCMTKEHGRGATADDTHAKWRSRGFAVAIRDIHDARHLTNFEGNVWDGRRNELLLLVGADLCVKVNASTERVDNTLRVIIIAIIFEEALGPGTKKYLFSRFREGRRCPTIGNDDETLSLFLQKIKTLLSVPTVRLTSIGNPLKLGELISQLLGGPRPNLIVYGTPHWVKGAINYTILPVSTPWAGAKK